MGPEMSRAPAHETNEPAWYTTGQLAALVGVTDRTVANWAEAGLLPHHTTPGGHRRFPADGVARFLDERAAGRRAGARSRSTSSTRLNTKR
jgi:excisionase family DNA binding protein